MISQQSIIHTDLVINLLLHLRKKVVFEQKEIFFLFPQQNQVVIAITFEYVALSEDSIFQLGFVLAHK